MKQEVKLPVAEFIWINPDLAKQFLEKNTKNRSINDRNLHSLINEMQKGNFYITGESIKFSSDGMLLDGQHRLNAIIKYGKPVLMLVVKGLDGDVFKYIDTGRKRLASDVLAIDGIKNPTKMSAIAKFVINFKRGNYYSVSRHKSAEKGISNSDVSEFVQQNFGSLNESYPYGFNKKNKLISGAVLSSLHFIFKQIDDQSADFFCHKLSDGSNLSEDSPIYVLRQKLLSDIRSIKKLQPIHRLALICKAWNLYRQGKLIKQLNWDSVKEAFPKPI